MFQIVFRRRPPPAAAGLRRALRLLALLAALLAPAAGAWAETRIALVVGNGGYRHGPLPNAISDARLISASLSGAGFEVTTALDVDARGFKEAVRGFADTARRAGGDAVAAFYYAGHAVQIGGRNFLVPIDAPISSAADVEYETVDAQWILDMIGETGAPLSIIMLDACRNNPFPAISRSTSGGLARMDAPRGALLSYSTAPGAVAYDGAGTNSPYASALSREMSTPGLKIEDVFKRVRRSVLAETNEAQTPWESSSLLGDFYFSGKGGQGAQPAAYAPPATPPPAATPAPPQQAGTPAGRRFRDCPDCPEMVEIPAGRFLFGSDRAEPGRATNEGPETVVTTRAFALGRTEVTRDEFARFVAETGHRASEGCWLIVLVWIHDGGLNWQDPGYPQRGDHPAVCISRADAEAYAAWMSRRTGASYRLPSEAELEWAMGGDRPGPWGKVGGDDPGFCRLANGHDESAFAAFGNVLWARVPCDDGYAYTAPVGSYPDGPFGLKDIHGNVGEWAADCWNDGHATAPADGSAARSGDCGKGVLKGASWIAAPADHRPAWRHPAIADDGSVYSGMRLARDL